MNKKIFSLAIVSVFVLSGCVLFQQTTEDAREPSGEDRMEDSMKDKNGEAMDDGAMMEDDTMMKDIVYDYSGQLSDVTKGETVRGVNTRGVASGVARAAFADGTYHLLATFSNLPDPEGSDFYEGWVVRKSPLDVISSGPLEKEGGVYTNAFTSKQDLTDHDFYVLTLEPDDGDPAPADHIVEGTLTKNGDAGVMMKNDKRENEGATVDDDGAPGPEAMEKDEQVSYSGTVLAGSAAKLLDFNKSDYDKALAANKKVALYFYANWCPSCKVEFPKMEAAFDQLSSSDVVGFRVNYNDSQTDNDEKQLARQFGVAYQHTKVFLKDGKRVLKSPETWETSRYLQEINNLI